MVTTVSPILSAPPPVTYSISIFKISLISDPSVGSSKASSTTVTVTVPVVSPAGIVIRSPDKV